MAELQIGGRTLATQAGTAQPVLKNTVQVESGINLSNPALSFTTPNNVNNFTIKAIDAPITDSQTGTTPDVSNSNSGQLAIYNGTTKLWGITEHGYVIKPKIPAFKARKSAVVNTTGNVIFDIVVFNQENFYDNTTGRATAPVSGLYFLLVKINHHNRLDMEIMVNGSGGSETGYSHVERGQFSTSSTGAGWYSSNVVTEAQLNAGDYVSINVSVLSQNSDPNEWVHFSGYLIG
tara:strand:- start:4572 stop:5273 length:702 start_codon:yes stop_codon:yes gene_type:complete